MKIVIYGKPNCPYCDMAKSLAERKGHDTEYKTLDIDYAWADIGKLFPQARTFPQILVDDKPIGGYSDLEELIG
jgi:glutaredoxin